MAPLDIDTALEWRGRTVVDRDGDKIGKLEELYLDESDRPAWGSVSTGLFGRRQSFVPLSDLRPAGDDLQVPYEKDRVKDAPNADPDEQLSAEEEDALHRHYGLGGASGGEGEARETAEAGGAEARRETGEARESCDVQTGEVRDSRDEQPGDGERPTGDADDEGEARPARPAGEEGVEMIRSEEEVVAGTTAPQPTERVRLRKVRVTEDVTRTVPVRREEVRLEHEPPPEGRIESVEDVEDERPA
jgi:PRC-barrel domain/Domain of unknown function (DUF2382)